MANGDPHPDESSAAPGFGRNEGTPRGVVKGGAWIGGVILIALGFIFLAQNFGFPMPRNWWALFILIPAFAALAAAWSIYQRNGNRMTRGAVGAAFSGLLLAAISVVFLLGYDFGKFWPVILIIIGLGVVTGSFGSGGRRPT